MELLSDKCIKVWKGRLGSSWERAFLNFSRFFDEILSKDSFFAGKSPSDLVEWQINAVGRERSRILRLAQSWINGLSLRYGSKQVMLSHVRSMFMHNQASLPEDRSFRFQSDIPPVEGKLTFEAFRAILHNCNKLYRAVFLMMAQGLMGEGELIYVSNNHWHQVLDALTKNVGVFKLLLPGRKRNRNKKNFYTMLSTKSDFADAYREYMKSTSHKIFGALFRNERGKPLNHSNIQNYFHWRAVEAGVIKQFSPECDKCRGETVRILKSHPKLKGKDGKPLRKIAYKCKECRNTDWAYELKTKFNNVRYGVNPHEIRDLMRSRWRESGAKIVVAEFMMEHNIDPNEYDKMKYTPVDAIAEYRKALPFLNVLSKDPNKVDRSTIDAELEGYRAESEVLRRELQTVKDELKKRPKPDPLLLDIEQLSRLYPGVREVFSSIVEDARAKLAKLQKLE